MPTGAMPNTCTCLREARRAAGYQNFGQAGLAMHRSQEVIGRHERGDVPLQANDAIEYAEAYGHPEILMAYCGECEIRRALFGKQSQRAYDLPLVALRVSNRLRSAARYADTLAEILDDGNIDSKESGRLEDTLCMLQSIEEVWRELVTACMVAGIKDTKKDRTAGTDSVGAIIKSTHHSKP